MSEARDRCLEILLQRWTSFPADLRTELEEVVDEALAAAAAAPVEILTVADATSRPRPLRLSPLAADYGADEMYRREWVEFSLEAGGGIFVVYRFKNGEDHAVEWTPSVSLPDGLMRLLPPAVATAVLGGDKG